VLRTRPETSRKPVIRHSAGGSPFTSPFSAISTACEAIYEPFAVLTPKPCSSARAWGSASGPVGISEKQHIKGEPAWQEIVDFFVERRR
jgi:hypothetical protein